MSESESRIVRGSAYVISEMQRMRVRSAGFSVELHTPGTHRSCQRAITRREERGERRRKEKAGCGMPRGWILGWDEGLALRDGRA
jgi:hypothetical protein